MTSNWLPKAVTVVARQCRDIVYKLYFRWSCKTSTFSTIKQSIIIIVIIIIVYNTIRIETRTNPNPYWCWCWYCSFCPKWHNLSRYARWSIFIGVPVSSKSAVPKPLSFPETKNPWINICLLPCSGPIWRYVGVYLMVYPLVQNRKHYRSQELTNPTH